MQNPGPVIPGAAQGASCFGPAYGFWCILETVLRQAKVCNRAPLTLVAPEAGIGHPGPDGVGDTKGLWVAEMRSRHSKWIISA